MRTRCAKIRLLLLDVDGVLTDGRIILDDNGMQTKTFHVRDGHGLKLLQRAGIEVGIITGRTSQVVEHRAKELGIKYVFQGALDKLVPYQQLISDLGIKDEEVAYIGDDVVDLPILRRVGLAATVADGVDEVRCRVDYVATRPGGYGAVREVCDLILKQSGRWDEVMARYAAGEDRI